MLEANGFTPAVVAGPSAGSVVGALYASGMNAFDLPEKAVALDQAKTVSYTNLDVYKRQPSGQIGATAQ